MKKKSVILILILVVVLGAAGIWLYLSKGIGPPPGKPISEWEVLFSYVPADPGQNYVVAVVNLEGLSNSMSSRLSAKDRIAAKMAGLKKSVVVAWPKEGITSTREMHYAVVCSTHGKLTAIKKRLLGTSRMRAIEGTCGAGIKCYQFAVGNSLSYLAFKGSKYIMASDNPETLGAMVRGEPNAIRGSRWHSVLHVAKEWVGAFSIKSERTPEKFSPSPSEGRTFIESLTINGHLIGIPNGFMGKINVVPKTKSGKRIIAVEVPGEWEISPILPSDAFVVGLDLNALHKAVAPEINQAGKPQEDALSDFKGNAFLEISFTEQRPLFYLSVTGLDEKSPILEKMGKPGEKIDATQMVSPVVAMVFGKTTLVRRKGGFTASNISESGRFKTSLEGLSLSKELMSDVLESHPAGFVCISPIRFVKGAALLLKPFFSQNPNFSEAMQKLKKSEQNPAWAKRVLLLARSPLNYEVRIEFKNGT